MENNNSGPSLEDIIKNAAFDKDVYIRLSDDEMKASVIIASTLSSDDFTEEHLIKLLRERGVKQGIKKEVIKLIVDNKIVNKEMVIAEGKYEINGEDGRFEYFFNTEKKGATPVKLDSDLDLFNMELFEIVNVGQIIARYHKSTAGAFGYTVTGRLKTPHKGKEKPALRGKGFVISQDGLTYTSVINGKITLRDNYIEISRVATIDGDLTISTGNIKFDGDVFIKGSVSSGMVVEATGDITVEGHVEAAMFKAGHDVMIKEGMQGGGRGHIEAKGNVSCKFLEAVNIDADGDVCANYIFNCNIYSKRSVKVYGKKSAIIGGHCKALDGIYAFTLGNAAEVATTISVGIDEMVMNQYTDIKRNITKVESELEILDKGIRDYEGIAKEKPELYNKILLARDIKGRELEDSIAQRDYFKELYESTDESNIVVKGFVYPGVKVYIDMDFVELSTKVNNVIFKKINNRVGVIKG